ncbi:MAG: P-loop NTPase [Clostridia bacterium]|nr:P-loop NTPase [Clostridia bacterium]
MKKINSKLMLSFEFHCLLKDVLYNFWLIILAALIAIMGVYIAERSVYKPEYTSSATVVIRAKASTSGAYTNFSASSEITKIFSDVFVQPSMKKLAARNIGEDSFQGTLSAAVNGDTNLMTISVTASSAKLAYNLLSSVLEVYPHTSEDIFSDAVIDILVDPQMPSSPSNKVTFSARWSIALIAAMLMGAAIVLISLLRETVKTQEMFEECVESKLIGTIIHEHPHLSFREMLLKKKRALLINDAFATLRFSEDYQKIATKLEYMYQNGGNKIFAITSIAENEGKSTAAANISIALAGRGYRVILADFDFHKPSIYKIFDFKDRNGVELCDILSGEISSREFKAERYKKSSLYLAVSRTCRKDSSEWLDGEATNDVINRMREEADFVIIDTPPISVSADAVSIIKKADKALLVVRTDCVSIADINDTIMSSAEAGAEFAGCLFNDMHKSVTLLGQMGADEGGYYGHKYGIYKHYADHNRQLLSDESFRNYSASDRSDTL